VIVDFSGSPLEWGILIGFGLSNVYSFWFVSRQVWRRVHDPEWRKYSDAWSWLGVALVGAGVLAMIAISLSLVILNAVWYLTH
jgi:hypothetical protein